MLADCVRQVGIEVACVAVAHTSTTYGHGGKAGAPSALPRPAASAMSAQGRCSRRSLQVDAGDRAHGVWLTSSQQQRTLGMDMGLEMRHHVACATPGPLTRPFRRKPTQTDRLVGGSPSSI